jgi:hypothetical protein
MLGRRPQKLDSVVCVGLVSCGDEVALDVVCWCRIGATLARLVSSSVLECPVAAVGVFYPAMVGRHLVLVWEWCSELGSSSWVGVGLALYECGCGSVVVLWLYGFRQAFR